ncbi:MAG: ABC transporter substrate-binding protein [Gammaproteobacteria bacterium]|nr:ABC transporter substrate-binding protein [Gammaproteobacteria bacterium]
MSKTLIQMDVTPTGMRLNDWVAQQEGFFAAEGLEVHVDWDLLERQRARQGNREDTDYDDIKDLRLGKFLPKSEMTTACSWGVNSMAGSGMGKIIPGVYGISPCVIFVATDSKIRTPADLRGVEIGVGLRAGSHFSALNMLEDHLPLEQIKVVNTGGFTACLQALIDRDVEAACLLPPQIYMAPQLGMRAVVSGEFKTLWWINDETADPDHMERYLRAMDRAEEALEEDLERYLPLWEQSTSDSLKKYDFDYTTFGRGERFVREPLDRAEFEQLIAQSNRWGLDNHVTERSYEKLVYSVS